MGLDPKGADAADVGTGVERIERDADGDLVVYLAGEDEQVTGARLARCFPWTWPDAYISVRNGAGKEVALLSSLDVLDDESRAAAEAELRDKVFNPRILRVLDHKDEFGVSSITAETDRGEVIFQFRGRDDVRMLSAVRALFRDVDGTTYEVRDVRELDAASRKHIEHYF